MRRSTWRDAVATVRRTPRLLVAQKLLRLVPFKPVDFGTLCFLRLDGVPSVPGALLRGHATVRRATLDDLPGLVQLQGKPGTFLERFASGDRCIVALVDQQIVGYEWFCEQALHQETAWGLPITIPDGFVYAYDAYVNPAFRNSGVWLRFKAYLGDWMSETGKLGVLTFVESGNLPSLNTHLRFGFRPAERVLAVKIMGLKVFRTLRTVGTASALSLLSLLLARGPLLSRPVHLGLQVIRCVAAARLR